MPSAAEPAATAATNPPAAVAEAPSADPASDPAALSAPPPAPDEAEVENPYGLNALWAQGDMVVRGTLILLAIMSMGSWYILVSKLIEQQRMLGQADEANASFWRAASVREGVVAMRQENLFRAIAGAGLLAKEGHRDTLAESVDLNSWVTMSLQRAIGGVINRCQCGLAFLATVGSTAPFVGLFGTVWGIYHALTAIGIAGQASLDKVAGPVGEALIMTAIGLAVAIPAVMGYNWLTRRNKVVMERVNAFASDLHTVLLGGRGACRRARPSAPLPGGVRRPRRQGLGRWPSPLRTGETTTSSWRSTPRRWSISCWCC